MPDYNKLDKRLRIVESTRAEHDLRQAEETEDFVEWLNEQERNFTWTGPDGITYHWEPWMPPASTLQVAWWGICDMAAELREGHEELYPEWLEKVRWFYHATHRQVPADTTTTEGTTDGSASH